MKMGKHATSILALAAVFAVSAPALAADVYDGRTTPRDAYSQPYSAPANANFGGLYLGAAVGYGIITESQDGSPFGRSFESPIVNGSVGFDTVRGNFVFGPFAEYTYITADEADDVDDWAIGVRAGVIVAPRTLLYASAAYAQLRGDEDSVDGLRVGLGTEFEATNGIFIDTKVNYTWYDVEDLPGPDVDVGDLRALVGLKLKLNSGIFN